MQHKILTSVSALAFFAVAACGDASVETPDSETAETPDSTTVEVAAAPTTVDLSEVSSGPYSLEKTHAFLTFEVGHNRGLSHYRVSFTDYDASLDFDADNPEASSLTVSINPTSLNTNYPGDYKAGHADSGFDTWEEDLARDEKIFNADAHPQITFQSTSVSLTGEDTGEVTGDLTLLGVTKPVTLDVTFNGHGNASWYGERDLIGFDASTTIKRSEFGMDAMIPNISDEVLVEFSGEFLQDE